MKDEAAGRHEGVGARDLEGIDEAGEPFRRDADDPRPRRMPRMPAIARGRDPLHSRERSAKRLALALGHEVEHLLDLIGARDNEPIRVAGRLRGPPDLQPSDDTEVPEEPQDAVSE